VDGTVSPGTDGADAIVQSQTLVDETIPGVPAVFTMTLASAIRSTFNVTYGAWSLSDATCGFKPGTNFGRLTELSSALLLRTVTEWKQVNVNTTIDMTETDFSDSIGGVGVEISVAPPAADYGDFPKPKIAQRAQGII
jgi:hypothetical protein